MSNNQTLYSILQSPLVALSVSSPTPSKSPGFTEVKQIVSLHVLSIKLLFSFLQSPLLSQPATYDPRKVPVFKLKFKPSTASSAPSSSSSGSACSCSSSKSVPSSSTSGSACSSCSSSKSVPSSCSAVKKV